MTISEPIPERPSGDQGSPRSGLARLATENAARRQRRVWSRRVDSWHNHGSTNLTKVTAAVLAASAARPGARVVDLGCGTGQISIPLAVQGCEVLAVDISPAMIEQLQAEVQRRSLSQVECLAVEIEKLALPPQSVDLVVSSYALHHLRDTDKERLVAAAFGWLRPGGDLVIADMMFGRGRSGQDRAIIRAKVVALAKKGPGGIWRIVKNAGRYLLRVQERPVPMDTWVMMLRRTGFTGVSASTIVAEAGLVIGHHPES